MAASWEHIIHPPEGVLRWRGGLRQIETERYADGSLILVDYNDGTTQNEPQIGRVSQPERSGLSVLNGRLASYGSRRKGRLNPNPRLPRL